MQHAEHAQLLADMERLGGGGGGLGGFQAQWRHQPVAQAHQRAARAASRRRRRAAGRRRRPPAHRAARRCCSSLARRSGGRRRQAAGWRKSRIGRTWESPWMVMRRMENGKRRAGHGGPARNRLPSLCRRRGRPVNPDAGCENARAAGRFGLRNRTAYTAITASTSSTVFGIGSPSTRLPSAVTSTLSSMRMPPKSAYSRNLA
ncbi:Uncharacterised protein [Chromobacterium violaceum]|uniref:Uncharacterized protein n=1 Tax=Chromobacterium violaceum TaxID=536 RepID=A0A3S4IVW5_CHRVL|nr:Uncharacterised protein [Chromobacterium violaceum]